MIPLECAASSASAISTALRHSSSVGIKQAGGDALLEGLTFQQLHDEERLPAGFADIVKGADVGMAQRRGCLGLAAEAFQRHRAPIEAVRQKLERHLSA